MKQFDISEERLQFICNDIVENLNDKYWATKRIVSATDPSCDAAIITRANARVYGIISVLSSFNIICKITDDFVTLTDGSSREIVVSKQR